MRLHKPLFTVRTACFLLGPALAALSPIGAAEPTEQAFKDWTVRCPEAGQAGRCVMSQLLKNRDNEEPVLLMEVGYLQQGPEPMVQFTVPLGVLLPAGVQLRVDDAPKTGRVPYTVCDKVGCKAIAKLEGDVLEAMKSGRELITTLTSPSGDTATMSVSLAGFTAALGALK